MPAITLHEPVDNATTHPLQAYAWTGATTHPRDPAHLSHNATGTRTFDRSLPRPIRLAWRDDAAPALSTWQVTLSRWPDLREPDGMFAVTASTLDVPHLHVDTAYYWQVARIHASESAPPASVSPIHRFRTHAHLPRWVYAPGMTNLRDMGGWPLPGGQRIRQGLVYRASEMNGHLALQAAGRRVLEDELGIRTDLDLRGVGEDVRSVLDEARVRWLNVPIRPYGEIRDAIYHNGYRRIIELFADTANYPILFHCWAGADRAGTVAYMLHAILGANAHQLAHDYELTSMAVWEDRLRGMLGYRALLSDFRAFTNGDPSPRAEVENYLHSIGVSATTLDRIREILIEAA